MAGVAGRTVPERMVDLMFHGLRVGEPRLNAAATDLLAAFGPPLVRRLVAVAASQKNGPAHRVRALGVVGRIGAVPGADDLLALGFLVGDRSPTVRAAAERVLAGLRPPPGQAGDGAGPP